MYIYEILEPSNGLAVKDLIHSIENINLHWHSAIEIIMVLRGSVSLRLADQDLLLREGDFILVNSNETHSLERTRDKNILIALQFDPLIFQHTIPDFYRYRFYCSSQDFPEEDNRLVKKLMAEIFLELKEGGRDQDLRVANLLNKLVAALINHYPFYIIENKAQLEKDQEDLERLRRITTYVNQNLQRKISLKELAQMEHLNYHYLSHFIKSKLGLSFQEYLNISRLNKAVQLLRTTDDNITNIANESGFSTLSNFNKIFRDRYQLSPNEYRQLLREDRLDLREEARDNYIEVDRSQVYRELFSYLDQEEEEPGNLEVKSLVVDLDQDQGTFHQHWRNMTSFARARDGLNSRFQEQIRQAQKDIGFNYVRFHGIFSDDMMIITRDDQGHIHYNWSYVNELFDFLLGINLRPFVEIGFMPSELKSSDHSIFWWGANISQPRDLAQWKDLVENFIKNIVNRYGLEEVSQWYFEVWNEADLEDLFWIGSQEEYFNFYRETGLSIKSIHPDLRVGGPAITHENINHSSWLDEFIIYCQEKDAPLDFISIHIYTEFFLSREEKNQLAGQIKTGELSYEEGYSRLINSQVYYNKDNTCQTLDKVQEKMDRLLDRPLELHVTEWNASALGRNLIHDTAFVPNFIIYNALGTNKKLDSLGYWTLSDFMEEEKLGQGEFHGNFGLISRSGIKKASYYAYQLLAKLGPRIVDQGEDYIVTRSGDNFQILVFNYAYFNQLFSQGDSSLLSYKDRYSVFQAKSHQQLDIRLDKIEGYYKISRYSLARESGSAFDLWLEMGCPENMSLEEIDFLKNKSRPDIYVEGQDIEGSYRLKTTLAPHEIQVFTLDKQYI